MSSPSSPIADSSADMIIDATLSTSIPALEAENGDMTIDSSSSDIVASTAASDVIIAPTSDDSIIAAASTPSAENTDAGGKTGDEEKKKKKKKKAAINKHSRFMNAVHNIGHRAAPGCQMSKKAISVGTHLLDNFLQRCASEAVSMAGEGKKATVTSTDIFASALKILPNELGKVSVNSSMPILVKYVDEQMARNAAAKIVAKASKDAKLAAAVALQESSDVTVSADIPSIASVAATA